MSYTVKAGIKELIFELIYVLVIVFIADAVRYFVAGIPLAADISVILLGGILVYFVYTKYCAVFTYTLGEEGLTVLRTIGRREKKLYIRYSDISKICEIRQNDTAKIKEYYVKSIFLTGKRKYIFSQNGAHLLVIEADAEFMGKLKELCNV